VIFRDILGEMVQVFRNSFGNLDNDLIFWIPGTPNDGVDWFKSANGLFAVRTLAARNQTVSDK